MSGSGIKTLAKETAIYGVSSIVGKFFNWLLVPLYSHIVTVSEYGVVSQLYTWIALIIIILTYGMETGYFRFASNTTSEESDRVYTTTMTSIAATALLFVFVFFLFNPQISTLMMLGDYRELVMIMAVTVAIDAFASIPFAYLRFKQRPVRFMVLKLIIVLTNIVFNLFFLVVCPRLQQTVPELIDWFYNPAYKVGYIVISNFLSSFIVLLLQIPDIFAVKWRFDFALLRKMLRYSIPLLMLGIAGIMNQTIDRLLFPYIYPGTLEEARGQLGVYQACFKIAMVMMMFTYAFRFAYEPFIFAKKEQKDNKQIYSQTMTYFVIALTVIYLLLVAFIDVLKLLLGEDFREAIYIVPFVLITYSFQGIYYNLSLWYKLTDRTIWGTYISLIGFAVTLVLNVLLVPKLSYWACVFASLISFALMMIICYFLGQKYYPIRYNLRKIVVYFVVSIVISVLMLVVRFDNFWLDLAWRLLWFVPFSAYVLIRELPTTELINQYLRKNATS